MKRRGRDFSASAGRGSQFMRVYLLLSPFTTPNTPTADHSIGSHIWVAPNTLQAAITSAAGSAAPAAPKSMTTRRRPPSTSRLGRSRSVRI